MTKVGEHITLDIIGTDKNKEYDPLVFEKVINEIAIFAINEAIGSTPATGGKVIPASMNISPSITPINPKPKAKSPNNITDFLSLKNTYELAAAAVKKQAGTTTITNDITSQSEPIPPVFAEPIAAAKVRIIKAINIFIYFIKSPFIYVNFIFY